jgi:peptide methionine sulfoxide reductase MsrB
MHVRPPTVAVGDTTQLFRRASTVVASSTVAPTSALSTATLSAVVAPAEKTVVKHEAHTSPVVVDSPPPPKAEPPAPSPKPLAVERVPPPVSQAPPTKAVSTEAVMERRHTGKWVHEFPKLGYFACVGCATPVAGSTSKVPSVKGYATFSSYFDPSVELSVVVPQMGVGDSFVAITCIKCKSFLGRLCTDEVDDGIADDLSQFNSKALKYVASPVPGGFDSPVAMDDRVARRRRNKGSLVDGSTSESDSDDADDDLWSSMRNRATTTNCAR